MARSSLDGRTDDEMPPRVNKPVPVNKDRLAMIEQVGAMFAIGATTV